MLHLKLENWLNVHRDEFLFDYIEQYENENQFLVFGIDMKNVILYEIYNKISKKYPMKINLKINKETIM
jgi:hypothetical protein